MKTSTVNCFDVLVSLHWYYAWWVRMGMQGGGLALLSLSEPARSGRRALQSVHMRRSNVYHLLDAFP